MPTDIDLSQPAPTTAPRWVGAALAGAIIAAWLAVHVYGVFFFEWSRLSWLGAPVLVALACWLSVGLFIVAHDCMHGSLVPGRPDFNRWVGRFCLTLYAGFDFDTLRDKHRLHHRYAGTAADPDFDAQPPHSFGHWYLKFFSEYFGLRQFLVLAAVSALYLLVLGAAYANLLIFWAFPAILSSLQLFTFGTYLPHHPDEDAFEDEHRTRSSDFSPLVSLLTCFHFGYHHAHHAQPAVPWWRLPRAHKADQTG